MAFYIFYESGIKNFLKWFINKGSKEWVSINLTNKVSDD